MLVDESESGDPALSSDDLAHFVDRLAAVDDTAADAELIDQITQLERMKSACAAAEAKLTVAFAAAQTAAPPAGQQRNTNVQRSIAGQIGLSGWTTATAPDGIGIITTTPTGHTFRSDPPPPPRSQPWADHSHFEARLLRHLRRAS